jgi:hypothetical protein
MSRWFKNHWDVLFEYLVPVIIFGVAVIIARSIVDSTGWASLGYVVGGLLFAGIAAVIFGLIALYRSYNKTSLRGYLRLFLIFLPLIIFAFFWFSVYFGVA